MSGPRLARIRDIVDRSRAAQGLPAVVTDSLTLGRVAELLRRDEGGPQAAHTITDRALAQGARCCGQR